MHIKAYINLSLQRLPSFISQVCFLSLPVRLSGIKLCRESCIRYLMYFIKGNLRPVCDCQSRLFSYENLTQKECFNSIRSWHYTGKFYRQNSSIFRLQLPQSMHPSVMFLTVSNIARFSASKLNCTLTPVVKGLLSILIFLTPHMRFQSSSRTDVAVLKTQPSKERIKQ